MHVDAEKAQINIRKRCTESNSSRPDPNFSI